MSSVVEIVVRAVDEFSSTLEDAQKKFGNLSKSFAIAGGAMVAAGGLGIKTLVGWAIAAGDTAQVQEGFNKLVGKEAPQLLEDFKAATDGVISTLDSMKTINLAMSRGIAKDTIPTIAKLADQLADAGIGGSDTAATFDLLTRAIATGQTRFLSQLGIVTDLDSAYKRYAEGIGKSVDDLTEQEKITARTSEIMQAYKQKMSELPDTATTLSESIGAMKNQFTDLTVQIGTVLIPVFSKIAEWLGKLITWFQGLSEKQKQFIAIGGALVAIFLVIVGTVLLLAAAFMSLNTALLPIFLIVLAIIAIILIIVALFIWWEEIVGWFREQISVFVEKVKADWQTLKDAWHSVWTAIANFFIGIWNGIIDGMQSGINFIINAINKVIRLANKVPGVNMPLIPNVSLEAFKATPVNDFVVTKGGEVLKTSPDDYLFGTKNPNSMMGGGGGNLTVIIEGNVYGTDPDEISRALWDKIRRKISI